MTIFLVIENGWRFFDGEAKEVDRLQGLGTYVGSVEEHIVEVDSV